MFFGEGELLGQGIVMSGFSGFSENLEGIQLSHKKSRILSIESWLFNRDPYVMVYEIIPTYITGMSSPTYPPKQPGGLFSLLNSLFLVGLRFGEF